MEPKGDSGPLARRARLLAPTYRLFYEQPLQAVRAEGVWLYDGEGRRYLDAYNNVPVVGHCHPAVVRAICDEARVLNTHTRYLTEGPLRLAEELLASFPAELCNVVFTCTSGEANDLAVQVSKVVTGGSGFIITDFAYHGATDVLAGMSPEEGAPLGGRTLTPCGHRLARVMPRDSAMRCSAVSSGCAPRACGRRALHRR